MMNVRFGRTATSFTVALVSLLGAPLAAQESPAAPPGARFEGEVAVDVVTVDVIVTDRKGNPITDLTADDFRVFEDGRRVELTNFLAVHATRSAAPDGGAEPPTEEPAATTPAPPEPPPRHLVVYLDWSYLGTPGFSRLKPDLVRFLREEVPEGTRVMLAVCDRRVEVVVPFTDDREELLSALEREGRRAGLGRLSDLDELAIWRIWAPELNEPMQEPGADDTASANQAKAWLEQSLNALADDNRTRARRSWRLLQSLVDSLAALEGRKVLLYVSEGVPLRPDLWQDAAGRASGGVRTPRTPEHGTLEREMLEVVAHANTVGVTIHSIYAEGMGSPLGGNVISPEVSGAVAFQRTDDFRDQAFNRESNLTDTIQTLARETGGLTVLRPSPKNLATLAVDVGSYYSLGYRPPRGRDGRAHEVRVEVDRKGAEVRHRRRSIALDRRSRVAAVTYSALLMESVRNPLGLELSVNGAGRRAGDGFVVPFGVQIPSTALALTPDGPHWTGQLRVFLVAISEDGAMAPLQEQEVPIRVELPPAEEEQPMLVVPGQLPLAPGLHTVVASVLDEVSGAFATTRAELVVSPDGGLWRPGWPEP